MILSASRRTDIPALYADWFMRRLRAGEFLVPDPYNAKRLFRYRISPENVDCIVFWSKNPAPLLPYLDELDAMGYTYYLQYTLNPYSAADEPGLPTCYERLHTFAALSQRLGPQRVVWRYDPVIFGAEYTPQWHTRRFDDLAERLLGLTDTCIVSFLDLYKGSTGYRAPKEDEMREIAAHIAQSASRVHMAVQTCCEQGDYSAEGIAAGACIDAERIGRILGKMFPYARAAGQRPQCLCAQSADVGTYDTCGNGCRYCYAGGSLPRAAKACRAHDPTAMLLHGSAQGAEIIDRSMPSCLGGQLSFL